MWHFAGAQAAEGQGGQGQVNCSWTLEQLLWLMIALCLPWIADCVAAVKRRAIRTATFDPVESHHAGKMLHF